MQATNSCLKLMLQQCAHNSRGSNHQFNNCRRLNDCTRNPKHSRFLKEIASVSTVLRNKNALRYSTTSRVFDNKHYLLSARSFSSASSPSGTSLICCGAP